MVAQMMSARAKVLSKAEPAVLQQWVQLTQAPEFAAKTAGQRAGGWYLAALANSQLGRNDAMQAALDQLGALVQGHPDATRQAGLLRADLALANRTPDAALAALSKLAGAARSNSQAPVARQTTTVSNVATGLVNEAVISRGEDKSLRISDMDANAPLAMPTNPAAGLSPAMGGLDRAVAILDAQALAQLPSASLAQHTDVLRNASNALQSLTAQSPKDAAAWQALATAFRLQGQPLRAIRAEAEARSAQYDYAAAVDRLRAGQDMARSSQNRNDYYEASIIDTRLREMQSLAKEQAARK
jgi:predicted Zn-dependent protease